MFILGKSCVIKCGVETKTDFLSHHEYSALSRNAGKVGNNNLTERQTEITDAFIHVSLTMSQIYMSWV
jgi:hypothetical protein